MGVHGAGVYGRLTDLGNVARRDYHLALSVVRA